AGVWVIQQNYLLDMMQQTTFDNLCHEHITYWSLRPLVELLGRHGLEVVAVNRSPVNGGCIRTVVSRRGVRPVDRSVLGLLREEDAAGLNDGALFRAFEDRTREKIGALRDFVAREYEAGKTFMIYAASTRGAVIWQAAGLAGAVTAAVERQTEKVGRWFSPLGVPIISEERARRERPDYLLVGPYWFKDQIIEREAGYLAAGGTLVFPLPEFEIVKGVSQ
ncbi:MAG TPA: hypothetical protein VHA75_03105, partial [Rugosimonospora sp.]|nr:hypothetical protein [Rugosimonospora sp.]